MNSGKVPTLASPFNPNGLRRNQLSWLYNGTVRGNGILQRTGWKFLTTVASDLSLFQGGFLYEPDAGNPYLIVAVGGRIYRVNVDSDNSVEDLSASFGLVHPADQPQFFFCQGEQFLVIQAGDYSTLPLFWDGSILRQSLGITNSSVAVGTPGVNEIPAAGPMDYYMGRIWYAAGRLYAGGDIVQGASGTLAYRFRDAILNVTENPLAVGGDGIVVPTSAGHIRAIKHEINLDQALGQGRLLIWTGRNVYALQVPVDRKDWIAAGTGSGNTVIPLQTLLQESFGVVGERSLVSVNGDWFYQSTDGIRSLVQAIRYFPEWGNVPISHNVNRALQFNDRSLMRFAHGVLFDNRLLQSVLPIQTPVGVGFRGMLPLDFDLISSLEEKKPPAWEGLWEGLDFLQAFSGDYGGLQRCFAIIHSRGDDSVQVWELTRTDRDDDADKGDSSKRVTWGIEFPSYDEGKPFLLKKLDSAEIALDKLFGTVYFKLEYRPDQDPCWYPWAEWSECAARTSCEDVVNPVCYPETPYRESFRATKTLPVLGFYAPQQSATGRPTNIGYEFQARLTIKGWCRIRKFLLHTLPRDREPYRGIITEHNANLPQSASAPTPPPSQQPPASPEPVLPPSQQQPSSPPIVLSILNTSLPDGTLGSNYYAMLNVSGGSGQYQWLITAGILPVGLTLNANGTITGVPTLVQAPVFTVQVKDTGPYASRTVPASRTFTLQVNTATVGNITTPLAYFPLHDYLSRSWIDSVKGVVLTEEGEVHEAPPLILNPTFLPKFGDPDYQNGSAHFDSLSTWEINDLRSSFETNLKYNGGGLTFACWFKVNAPIPQVADHWIHLGHYQSGQNTFDLDYNQLLQQIEVRAFGGDQIAPAVWALVPVVGQRYFIVGYYHPVKHVCGLSLDGSLIDPLNHEGNVTSMLTPGPVTGQVTIGMNGNNAEHADYFEAEVGLWNTMLTDAEIAYLYNGGSGRTWPL